MGPQKPFEVSIEVNRQCNYFCSFCFAKNFSMANSIQQPSKSSLKKVLKKIAGDGISRVRFTGGEPLLRRDFVQIARFAKKQGLFVSLNTNGSLLSEKNIKTLSPFLDDTLVSMHADTENEEKKLSQKKGLLGKKLKAIKTLSSQGVFVRAATILTPKNIKALERFHSLVKSLPVSQWVLLRPIPNPTNPKPVSRKEIAIAIEKIIRFNKGKPKSQWTLIENALPFCCCDPAKVSKSALGGLREDGHSALFIDATLTIKPSYFLDLPLGNALRDSVISAWKSSFMKRMHALEFIAEPCHKCRFVKQCMGGSRFAALFSKNSLYALDPLANPTKFKRELFSQRLSLNSCSASFYS